MTEFEIAYEKHVQASKRQRLRAYAFRLKQAAPNCNCADCQSAKEISTRSGNGNQLTTNKSEAEASAK